MHHPSIVEFYRAFAFENHTYVVLELCPNGSLMDMVKARKSLSLPEVRRYMIQLCGGVKYMHQRSVIHRDLKMGNIFIDAHMNVKIGDFGLAAVLMSDDQRRQTMCGTPNYIAPELLVRPSATSAIKRGHDYKVDTWAMGIICYAMLIGTPPFASKSQTEIYAKLKQLQYEWKEDCQYFIPNQAKDLVTLCLNLVPTERPGMDDLVEHDFFKMGAIADELDRNCLRTTPTWLEHADPRGDKVTAGYGVDHAVFCEASGVGMTPTGRVRPSVGRNATVSTMVEIDLENAEGCAPVVPMPDGVIYKEFAAAKEHWQGIRKRPLAASKIRSRKETATATEPFNMNSLSDSLPKSASARNISTTFPPGSAASGSQQRASVQSFAAQQRQQALPSRAPSRRVLPTKMTTEAASTGNDRAQVAQESRENRFCDKKDDDDKREAVVRSSQTSQGFLREQPVRAVSRATRSTSTRSAVRNLPEQDQQKISASERAKIAPRQPGEENRPMEGRCSRLTARSHNTSQTRSMRRKVDESSSIRPSSSSSGTESADMPLRETDGNNQQPKPALTGPKSVESNTSKTGSVSPKSGVKAMVIGPTDKSSLVPGTSTEDVLSSLRRMYRDLCPKSASTANMSSCYRSYSSGAHSLVERWVDYADRYGIGYVLSDGTAGITLRSGTDYSRSSSCVVIRCAKEHYARRIREGEVQIVPQGAQALPVEFYENFDNEGLRKMQVPAKKFRYDQAESGKWVDGKEVIAQLSKEAKEQYAAERIKLVGLLDKFGKYMHGLDCSDMGDVGDPKAESFVRFYQRLGNVGIWGFGDCSFQFNFPDHTKVLVYQSCTSEGQSLMLDLYHLQPEDAVYLAKYGSMTERGMDRRDSITAPVSEILSGQDPRYTNILTSNQVLEKLLWIRAVMGVWVREGGLGKIGKEPLAWGGLQDKATERGKKAKMVWVTVGRDGGDGDVVPTRK